MTHFWCRCGSWALQLTGRRWLRWVTSDSPEMHVCAHIFFRITKTLVCMNAFFFFSFFLFWQPPVQVFGLEGRYAHALYSAASKEKKLDVVEKEMTGFKVRWRLCFEAKCIVKMGPDTDVCTNECSTLFCKLFPGPVGKRSPTEWFSQRSQCFYWRQTE